MEPQIQFCTSADGARIAYSVMGQGPPLVFVPGWGNNLELQLKHPDTRKFFLRLSREHLLVQFDCRGVGLSQRDVQDLSLETYIADINAVADRLDLQHFDLWGVIIGAAIGAAYAARYPERVSKLVLWAGYSHGEEIISQDAMQGLVGLTQSNWSLARRTLADLGFPSGPTESRRWFSNLLRQTLSPETLGKYLELQISLDIRSQLPQVKAPTLLLHRRGDCGVPIAAGRAAAALIPDARFIALDGDISHLCCGDLAYIEQVLQFLEGRSEAATAPSSDVPDKETDPMIGKTISHYKILEKLGEGGMGVVYRAEDTKLKRQVALKFLPPELVRTAEWKQRFIREAQASAALAHPNICTIHEIDELEGHAFIAMECIDGISLTEKIESRPLDVNEAIDLTLQIAEGLQEAHEKGIIHRDIKAANIMLTKKGHARIMDFGLAKLAGQTRLTKTATIMGTVAYMSPEQAHGKSAIDHRTDIWSLGVVLYEMLTGTQPFTAPTDAGLIYKIVHEEPEPVTGIRSEVPEALAQAVKKMMQKEPVDRYEDMEALISDLKSIRSGAAPDIAVKEKHVPSIVVLPFVDMSPAKDQEYFCDGISESIINELTRLSNLRVIARTSAFSFKGQNLDVREIGKKLNVGTVLEGSIQKAGDRVRVTTQLVNTARGEHLWSEKFDRKMEDIFAIQDEISEAIVSELKPRLLLEEKEKLAKRQTVDLAAYNLYLKGRWFWNKWTEEDLMKAIECFEQAIEKSPNYAAAYCGLADSYIDLPYSSIFPSYEANPKAKQAALEALKIDPELAEAHASLGRIMDHSWDWERAEKEFMNAIELNPGYAHTHHWYALHLTFLARFDEALKEIKRALELDPLSLVINTSLGIVLHYAGHHDQAIEVLQKTAEMDPHFGYVHIMLGFSYLGKSMHKEALEEFQKERELSRIWDVPKETYSGVAYALLGRKEEANKILDELLERSKATYVPPWFVAYLHFALREDKKGFEWLEKAYDEGCGHWLCWLKVHPVFRRLRSDPRYVGVLQKIGLEESGGPLEVEEPSPSIAVLPFVNMSADPDQEYFCDGLAEELINGLTQIKDLKVIARTSAFSFKGKNVNVREIGRELDVESILEGSVRKAGNRIRITAQLVEASSGHHLWSEKYDRDMEDIFAIQDEITLAIVENLKPMLLGEERARLAKRQTIDLDAHNLFLQGKFFWNKQTGTDHKKAIEFFERAVQKEPDYAQAWAGMADCYTQLSFYSFSPPKEAYRKARQAALKALEINDFLAEGHASLGFLKTNHERDWKDAESEYKRAIELNPGYAGTRYFYSWHLIFMGRYDEAIEQIKRAFELDPLSLVINREIGCAYLYAGKYEQAIEALKRTIAMDVSFPFAHYFLGLAYFFSSRFDEAAREFEGELRYMGDFDPMREGWAGQGFALLGNLNKAREIRDRLLDGLKTGYVSPYLLGTIHMAMDDYDEGFKWMEKAYEEMDPFLGFLKPENFRLVGSDPRYVALLKKMNLEP